MEKRVLLALALSSLVLAAWYYFAAPPSPPNQVKPSAPAGSERSHQEKGTNVAAQRPSPGAPGRIVVEPAIAPKQRDLTIETPYWRARFISEGAVATNWTISRLRDGNGKQMKGHDKNDLELVPQVPEVIATLGAPFAVLSADPSLNQLIREGNYDLGTDESRIRIEPGQQKEIAFKLAEPRTGLSVTKRFTFYGDRYDFVFRLDANRQGNPLDLQLVLGPNFADQSVKETGAYLTPSIAIAQTVQGKVTRIQSDKVSRQQVQGPITWAGVEDNYFALIAVARENFERIDVAGHSVKESTEKKEIERHFVATTVPIRSGTDYLAFAGPKDPEILRQADKRMGSVGLENVISYGILSTVVRPVVNWILLPALNFTFRYVHNYGIAIIILTLLINTLFFPLKWKMSVKMRKAAAFQPKLKEMQDRIKGLKKGDPQFQRLQMEQMKLMKEANPFGGCLPMLAQLPIFWAFYVLLTVSIDVRQAPFFGWIDNLSLPDRFHILPVVMCLSMIGQSVMTPTPAAAGNPSQKMMMYIMPVVVTAFIFWKAPSGLVLYWFISNLVGIGQQFVINKLSPAAPPEDPQAEKKPQKRRLAHT